MLNVLMLFLFITTSTQITKAFPTITSVNPVVKDIMEQVDIDSLENYIRYLQDLGHTYALAYNPLSNPPPLKPQPPPITQHPNNIAAMN